MGIVGQTKKHSVLLGVCMATVDRVGVVWQPPLTARTNSNIVSISIVQGRETREGKLKGRVIEHQAVQYRREIKEKGVNALTRAREDGGSDAEVCSVPSVVCGLTLQGSYVLHRDPADLFTLPDLYFSAPAFRIRRCGNLGIGE